MLAEHITESLAQALQGYSLTDPETAQKRVAFLRMIDKKSRRMKSTYEDEADRAAEKNAKALMWVLEKDKNALLSLGNGDIGALLSMVASEGYHDDWLLRTLYYYYTPSNDLGFSAWFWPKTISLFQQLGEDRLVTKSMEEWQEMTSDEKRDLASHVTNIQAAIYGYPPPPVVIDHLDNAAGMHDAERGLIIDPVWAADMSFDLFLNTIVHENDHVFQHHLVARYGEILPAQQQWLQDNTTFMWGMSAQQVKDFNLHMASWIESNLPGGMADDINSNLLLGGRLRELAYTLAVSAHHYLNTAEHMENGGYSSNPCEQHSMYLGYTFAEYLMMTEEDRKTLLDTFANNEKFSLTRLNAIFSEG